MYVLPSRRDFMPLENEVRDGEMAVRRGRRAFTAVLLSRWPVLQVRRYVVARPLHCLTRLSTQLNRSAGPAPPIFTKPKHPAKTNQIIAKSKQSDLTKGRKGARARTGHGTEQQKENKRRTRPVPLSSPDLNKLSAQRLARAHVASILLLLPFLLVRRRPAIIAACCFGRAKSQRPIYICRLLVTTSTSFRQRPDLFRLPPRLVPSPRPPRRPERSASDSGREGSQSAGISAMSCGGGQSGWLLDYGLVEEEIQASDFIYMVDDPPVSRSVSFLPYSLFVDLELVRRKRGILDGGLCYSLSVIHRIFGWMVLFAA